MNTQLTDDFIKNYFTLNNSLKINPSRTSLKYLNKHIDIKNYLLNRFTDINYDETNIYEIIYRIVHNIQKIPKCKICGKPLKFKRTYGYGSYCSQKCVQNDKEIKQKKEQTSLKHFGTKTPLLSQEIKEKSFKTNIIKYGVKTPSSSLIIKEKVKQTNIKNLGVPYTSQNKNCIEKMRQTCIEKYGVEHNFQIKEVQEHRKQYWLNKYGVDNPMKVLYLRQKNYNTKKQNKTFNTSKIENNFYEYLKTKFNEQDIYRQYNSDKYPFNCDFYIKTLNLYIEIQAYWCHMNHPFDKNNLNDINKLKELQEKHYNKAIEIWTIRDVKKRMIAKENNLNYLEIFTNKLDEAIKIFETYLNG